MNCCQCQGIEEIFSQQYVRKELSRYRAEGPLRTTLLLTKALATEGVAGLSLLDIGGGVGGVQHELIDAGVEMVTSVDASSAYLAASRAEAQRRGLVDQVSYHHGNFVDLAPDIAAADIVTLDRVICCYHDMDRLVSLSVERARTLYGLVYPRDRWWIKLGLAVQNFYFWLRRNPFRSFVHPTKSVEGILRSNGFERSSYHQTWLWQVVVYHR